MAIEIEIEIETETEIKIKIRRMTIDDYDEIYKLWTSAPGMGLNDLDDSREGIKKYLKRNSDTCFVAVLCEKIEGAIMAGHDGRRGYIYHTAVSEAHRKKGIGSALVHTVADALRDEGINKVALVVFRKNELGNAFWESLGFGEREDLVYRNYALTEMKRRDT